MIVIYQPEGAEPHRWDLKKVRILSTEAEAIERCTGLEWEKVTRKVATGSMLAIRAVAWVLLKREDTSLAYRAFVPAAGELGYEPDAEELAVIRDLIEKDTSMDPDEKAEMLADFDEVLAEAEAAADGDAAAGDEDPEQAPKASADGASPTAA